MDYWKLRPERTDNHWPDCPAGSARGRVRQGSTLANTMTAAKPKKRISLSVIQAARRDGRPVEPFLRGGHRRQYGFRLFADIAPVPWSIMPRGSDRRSA